MEKDPAQRLTCKAALQHEWIAGETAANIDISTSVQAQIRRTQVTGRWKKVFNATKALSRMRRLNFGGVDLGKLKIQEGNKTTTATTTTAAASTAAAVSTAAHRPANQTSSNVKPSSSHPVHTTVPANTPVSENIPQIGSRHKNAPVHPPTVSLIPKIVQPVKMSSPPTQKSSIHSAESKSRSARRRPENVSNLGSLKEQNSQADLNLGPGRQKVDFYI